jgi:hypothetical protein
MLQEIEAGKLWVEDQPFSKLGFDVGARMTVARLPEGGLWVHSPLAADERLRRELDALGPVRFLVAPSGMHYMDLPEFARAYPEAEVYVAEAAAQKLRGVKVTGVLGDAPPPAWAGVIDQAPLRGNRMYDEVVFCHRPTRTLIATDLFFNLRAGSASTRAWAKLLGIDDRFGMSRSFRFTITDREQVRASLSRVLEWDFDRVIVTHGEILERGGKPAVRAAVERYL